ncbi:hypothetical protein CFB84_38580 [Burkholderia aenigmatica]|uniref:Uncharacterized protein n=1 Tax=Burkholderia aenigmatica TaxID=2015348 RepID=A0A228HTX5_9BURK|nr:hypothetical protein CFB84_38580 [Burkholderia aenigmatica]
MTDAMRETDYGRVLIACIPARQPDKPAGRNDRFLPRAIDGGRRPLFLAVQSESSSEVSHTRFEGGL